MKGIEWCVGYVTHRWLFPFKHEREQHEDYEVTLNVVR